MKVLVRIRKSEMTLLARFKCSFNSVSVVVVEMVVIPGTHSSDSRKFTCLAQRAAELLRLETKYKPPDQNIVLWV